MRQSGTQNGIPRERWSRVRGPQLGNLRELKETSGLVGLHLGKRRGTPVPGLVGAWGAAESSSTGQTLASSLNCEAASTQGKGNGYRSHTQNPFQVTVSTARWEDLTDPLGCLTWDWVSTKGEKHRQI